MNESNMLKMIFIFNALNDGWLVKKINSNQYEFIKNINDNNYLKQLYLDNNFLNKFINDNLKIENI